MQSKNKIRVLGKILFKVTPKTVPNNKFEQFTIIKL